MGRMEWVIRGLEHAVREQVVYAVGRNQKIDVAVLSKTGQRMNSRVRCNTCHKKLGLMEYTCKCERRFCISHLPPQEHQCTFDFKKEAEKKIQAQMDSEPRACSFERI